MEVIRLDYFTRLFLNQPLDFFHLHGLLHSEEQVLVYFDLSVEYVFGLSQVLCKLAEPRHCLLLLLVVQGNTLADWLVLWLPIV